MNQYYFMTRNRNAKGTPIYLDGILHTQFIPREEYKGSTLPPILNRDKWRGGWMNLTELPEKLYLINKHRLLDFDYCDTSNGFIISEEFKEIMDAHNPMKYLFTPVVMLNRDGEVNSRKSYYFITIQEDVQAIDFDKSEFIETIPPNINVGERYPKVEIKKATKIVFNKEPRQENRLCALRRRASNQRSIRTKSATSSGALKYGNSVSTSWQTAPRHY